LCAKAQVPSIDNLVGIIGTDDGVIGRHNVSRWRIVGKRKFFKGDITLPDIFVRPAGHRGAPIARRADGYESRHLITDIAIYICIKQVLRRRHKVASSLAKLLEILGAIDFKHRSKSGSGFQRRPAQGNRIILRHFDAGILIEICQVAKAI